MLCRFFLTAPASLLLWGIKGEMVMEMERRIAEVMNRWNCSRLTAINWIALDDMFEEEYEKEAA
jgi:hypothetical protein